MKSILLKAVKFAGCQNHHFRLIHLRKWYPNWISLMPRSRKQLILNPQKLLLFLMDFKVNITLFCLQVFGFSFYKSNSIKITQWDPERFYRDISVGASTTVYSFHAGSLGLICISKCSLECLPQSPRVATRAALVVVSL